MAFKATMREHGVKHAFQARDAAFGSGYASVHGRDPD
jgi:enoyl-CoA hydratase